MCKYRLFRFPILKIYNLVAWVSPSRKMTYSSQQVNFSITYRMFQIYFHHFHRSALLCVWKIKSTFQFPSTVNTIYLSNFMQSSDKIRNHFEQLIKIQVTLQRTEYRSCFMKNDQKSFNELFKNHFQSSRFKFFICGLVTDIQR